MICRDGSLLRQDCADPRCSFASRHIARVAACMRWRIPCDRRRGAWSYGSLGLGRTWGRLISGGGWCGRGALLLVRIVERISFQAEQGSGGRLEGGQRVTFDLHLLSLAWLAGVKTQVPRYLLWCYIIGEHTYKVLHVHAFRVDRGQVAFGQNIKENRQ